MKDSLILDIKDLTVNFSTDMGPVKAVDHISFSLMRGGSLGIVGESGSGKSVTALSLLRLLSPAARIESGQIMLYDASGHGVDLLSLGKRQLQQVRGRRIAMIFQEPMTSLNPVVRCGKQVAEVIRLHLSCGKKEAVNRVMELFREVRLPDPERIFSAYPHELSGGQRQRVMIAIAIAAKPDILVADEPTTALDVSVQQSIIDLLTELQARYGMAILFITHDLELVRTITTDLIVMQNGRIVESGPAEVVFKHPDHPYTKALLASRTSLNAPKPKTPVPDASSRPLIRATGLRTWFGSGKRLVRAVDGVDLTVYPGEVLGLVGESGCGKTTLGRTLLRLSGPASGSVWFDGIDLMALNRKKLQMLRKDMQIIFQDPYSSLNPKMTIGKAITEPMAVHGIGKNFRERKQKAMELLEKTGLDTRYFDRYPHELSGGQRQRVCIARALSVHPKFIVCDESVSALDVTIQAQILKLLLDLRDEFGFTYIFISHDLAVVRHISDRIATMKNGKIVQIQLANETTK